MRFTTAPPAPRFANGNRRLGFPEVMPSANSIDLACHRPFQQTPRRDSRRIFGRQTVGCHQSVHHILRTVHPITSFASDVVPDAIRATQLAVEMSHQGVLIGLVQRLSRMHQLHFRRNQETEIFAERSLAHTRAIHGVVHPARIVVAHDDSDVRVRTLREDFHGQAVSLAENQRPCLHLSNYLGKNLNRLSGRRRRENRHDQDRPHRLASGLVGTSGGRSQRSNIDGAKAPGPTFASSDRINQILEREAIVKFSGACCAPKHWSPDRPPYARFAIKRPCPIAEFALESNHIRDCDIRAGWAVVPVIGRGPLLVRR